MPQITEADQDAIEDSPSQWVISLLLALQFTFLAACLVLL